MKIFEHPNIEFGKKISKARKWLEENIRKERELNPPNNWGDVDSFIEGLKELERVCEESPTYVWSSWR